MLIWIPNLVTSLMWERHRLHYPIENGNTGYHAKLPNKNLRGEKRHFGNMFFPVYLQIGGRKKDANINDGSVRLSS